MSIGVFSWYMLLYFVARDNGNYDECEMIDKIMVARGGTTLSQVLYYDTDSIFIEGVK